MDFIERIIIREGHRAVGIHGDKSQLNRDSVKIFLVWSYIYLQIFRFDFGLIGGSL